MMKKMTGKVKIIVSSARCDPRKEKLYARVITGVDPTKTNGYAFEGEFIPLDTEVELPVGALVMRVGFEGSRKNGVSTARLWRVTPEGLEELSPKKGNPETYYGAGWNYRRQFITIRDTIAELLGEEVNPLAGFSDEEILAEARRRGLVR